MPVLTNSLPSAIKPHNASGVAEKVENVTELLVIMSWTVAGDTTSCSRSTVLASVDAVKQKMEPLNCCSQIPTIYNELVGL